MGNELTLLNDIIENIIVKDDSLYIKLKKDLIIETDRHCMIYSKNGEIAIKSKFLHLNPDIEIKNNNPDEIIENIWEDNHKKQLESNAKLLSC
jgi:hypothetical protein